MGQLQRDPAVQEEWSSVEACMTERGQARDPASTLAVHGLIGVHAQFLTAGLTWQG